MKEEYKFPGFSSNIALYAEMERYGVDLIEEIVATLPDRLQWAIVEYMGDGEDDKRELVRRRFAVSPETVTVGYHNSRSFKGVRVQIHDPTANGGAKLDEEYGVPFVERPAILTAFMDTFGEEGYVRFSRDLVIGCELTKRTEAIATDLMRRYLCDGLSYEAMAAHADSVSDREAQLWDKWKNDRRR